MEDTTRDLLQEEIKQLFGSLKSLDVGSREYASAVDDLTQLYKLKIEEIKNDWEFDEKYNIRAMEDEHHTQDNRLKEEQIISEIEDRKRELALKEGQLAEMTNDRYFKYGVEVGLAVLTMAFYAVWMNKGFRFEETGTYTSKTFMGLFNRFKPTRK